MAHIQRYEGTWEEVNAQLLAHAEELRSYKRLSLVIEPKEEEAEEHAQTITPNEGMLSALREIAERQKSRRHTDGSDTDRMLREARAGAMWGYEPTE